MTLLVVALAVVVIAAVAVVVRQRVAQQSRALAIEVLSSRPDAVTGGDARIRVVLPRGVEAGQVTFTVDGHDARGSLSEVDGSLEGVVDGLAPRTNTVAASAPGAEDALVTLTNHPISGPLLAGPHEEPFSCQTSSFKLVSGGYLGKPRDADCTVTPRTDYVYRSTADQAFHPLSAAASKDLSQRPADLATISNPDGTSVPFIVRVETRTVDRGISEVAMLADPADPTRDSWNHKLLYTFGGGCDGGWYVQGTVTGGVMSPRLLSKGYAIASNTLNVFGQNCNDLLATESFAMTREKFIEDHGMPSYTMGIGCSGGSYQANQIADNYPGLLDGIVVGCSFSDVGFDTGQMLFDSRLLSAYNRNFPGRLTAEQLQLVSGFGSPDALVAMSNAANRMNPEGAFDPAVPAKERYDPKSNPKGARSTLWDHTVNVYGSYATTGFARRPIDNVGVQYGLKPLQDGAISLDQFLDLNRAIGGLDLDLHPTSERTVGDRTAVAAAYATGRLLNGGGGLDNIPIIDFRTYTEGPSSTDLHMRYHTFVTQARLIAANGDADNEVLLTVPGKIGFDLEEGVLPSAIDSMDQWISNVEESGRSGHRTVVSSKPADLVDACWTAAGTKVAEKQTYQGSGQCNKLYPAFSAPRLVAGEPLTADVVQCVRRPIDLQEYKRPFSAAQLRLLQKIFPTGVCDYTVPGREASKPRPWIFIR